MWKYVGGDTFMQTLPVTWRYAELMFSLAEKVDGAVSVKYQLPGEELDPDSLISVSDDSDLQVWSLKRSWGAGGSTAAGQLDGGSSAASACRSWLQLTAVEAGREQQGSGSSMYVWRVHSSGRNRGGGAVSAGEAVAG